MALSLEEQLERGREAQARGAWGEAYDAFSAADEAEALDAEHLESLSLAAYMLGRDQDYLGQLERVHHAHLNDGRAEAAAASAFWLGVKRIQQGEIGPAMGWFGRAERLLEDRPECAVTGYLMIPALFDQIERGDDEAALAITERMMDVGRSFGDADLVALGSHEKGQALVRLGRRDEGMRLIDETMVAVTSGELSPRATGIVYCNTIAFCQGVLDTRRARDWTAALSRWCERQPDMVAHTGVCLVHRAEIMQLDGEWPAALTEAQRACDQIASAGFLDPETVGKSHYCRGEIHRLQGDAAEAEAAYREASRHGFEPQPGLALLRLAQGETEQAAAAMRRVLAERAGGERRAPVLAAHVEIMLAAGDAQAAGEAASELEAIAAEGETDLLTALARQASGAVALAAGDPEAALPSLREAVELWSRLRAPYEAARARALAGLACRAVGDADSATLELEAARRVFETLGATPELGRLAPELGAQPAAADHGLTARELEVLRMVAAGATNKAIAAELVLSERTIDRHVSNIYAKLRVSSRSAATAYAYEHELI